MKTSLIIFALAIFFSMSAFSQDKAAPCKSDILNFCAGVQGRPAVIKCLKQNQKDLSPSCKAQFAEAKSAINDCKKDIKKWCKKSEEGYGKMLQCLKENIAKISPACKAHVVRQ